MAMFMGSIRSLASDCKKKKRFCLVNLTDDDQNATDRLKLTECQIIGIGREDVSVKRILDGKRFQVKPVDIQRVW